MLQPSFDQSRGLFVSVDGPSGAGKSTIVEHLAQLLVASGEEVYVTAEPSGGPIGRLCRELTETVTGYALACLPCLTEKRPVEIGTQVIDPGALPTHMRRSRRPVIRREARAAERR